MGFPRVLLLHPRPPWFSLGRSRRHCVNALLVPHLLKDLLFVCRQGIGSRVPLVLLKQQGPIREADQSPRHLEPLGTYGQRHWQLSSLKNFKRGLCSAGQLGEEVKRVP